MASGEGNGGNAGNNGSSPLWMDELGQHLQGLDAYIALGNGPEAGTDEADPTELTEVESQYPLRDFVSSHYEEYRDYVLPVGYRGPESGDGNEGSLALRMVGIAIPDPDVQNVAVVFTSGAYYLLRRPQEPEEQRAFLADFMPGGHPFILHEMDESEVPLPPHRQFLIEATYDPADIPPDGDAFEQVKEAIILTDEYRAQWREMGVQRLAQLAIAFSEAQPQQEPEQQ